MSESATPAASLPPPPASAGAPGYDNNAQGNGQANPSHMPPPPLAPVIIPQNTNPIPTAISSPLSGGVMSPTSGGPGYVRRAAPEPNKRALYVGGLDPRVTEDVLRQIFETTGHVQNVKIIPDKNVRLSSFSILQSSSSSQRNAAQRAFGRRA
jgi:nucleolysin TIA-1/TIAR